MEIENLPQNHQEGYYEKWEADEIAEQQVRRIIDRSRPRARDPVQGGTDIPKVEIMELDSAATHPRLQSREQLGVVRASILRKLGVRNKPLSETESSEMSDYISRHGPQSIPKQFMIFATSMPNLYLLTSGDELDGQSILVALQGADPEMPSRA
jgi:hypothetical protein